MAEEAKPKETIKAADGRKGEKINLQERVEIELLQDMPGMRKRKGDIVKTHPKNVAGLVKKKIAKKV